jgi:AraC-like DNA-binding protein
MIKSRQHRQNSTMRGIKNPSTTTAPARASVPVIGFHNPRLAGLGVDVFSLAELRRRAPHTLRSPQRVQFHLLLLVHQGHSPHMIDFQDIALKPHDVFFIRPGQVQQWRLHDSLQGWLLLIKPEALVPSIARAGRDLPLIGLDDWPCHWALPPQAARHTRRHLLGLARDIAAYRQREADAAAIGHGLLSLLLWLAGEQPAYGPEHSLAEANLCRQFLRLVDTHIGQLTSARALAARLGCSESTLNRATLAQRGKTAKQLLDERVLLETKRLLVHGHLTVAGIAEALGFAEPTHLVRFFRRLEGVTPAAYAARLSPAAGTNSFLTTTLPME